MLSAFLPIIVSLLPLVRAGTAAIGCSGSLHGAYINGPGAAPGGFSAINNGNCAVLCERNVAQSPTYRDKINYSYFSLGSCYCTNSPPAAFDIGACDNFHRYTVTRLGTSFYAQGCNTAYPSDLSTPDLNACFDMCRGASGVQISAQQSAPNESKWFCSCISLTQSQGQSTACGYGYGKAYTFFHSELARASQLNRRRKVHVTKDEDYCPGSLTACKVAGSSGYECIDTSSELESCGGCLHGEYSASRQGVKGVNCAALDGGLYGTLTCKAGQCADEF